MLKSTLFCLTCILMLALFVCCGRRQPDEETEHETHQVNVGGADVETVTIPTDEEIIENLALLGKVWGFAKYHHPSFLTGRLCWDAELLRLIPPVRAGGDVRWILYEWFTGLGESGYGLPYRVYFTLDYFIQEVENSITPGLHPELMNEMQDFVDYFTSIVESDGGLFWRDFKDILENRFPILAGMVLQEDENLRPMAVLSWINYENLGLLAAHLLQTGEIRVVGRRSPPVSINLLWASSLDFSNQLARPLMDFQVGEERLLALFRLWNAMNYYFPHLDTLDVPWNDLLVKFIPKMLEGTDRLSYQLTLAALAHYLHDANIAFHGANFFVSKFGHGFAPVHLVLAEGQLVVYEVKADGVPLERGDVILSVDGRNIGEITSEMKQFLSFPNDEKAITLLSGRLQTRHGAMWPGYPHALTSRGLTMDVSVLRGALGTSERVIGSQAPIMLPPQNILPHVLLDDNIGLINHAEPENIRHIMESFAYTEGIVIDLRRMGFSVFTMAILPYLTEEPLPLLYTSNPSRNHPGRRSATLSVFQPQARSPYTFIYDRPVVLLMDEQITGIAEWMLMSLRAAPNVTVIGTYSLGSLRPWSQLPLPGSISMHFSSMGVYTPEGGQIHRMGIAPDIRVDRTIQGIADGRDEIMEAALRFILGE